MKSQPKGAAPVSREVVEGVRRKMAAPAGPPPAGMVNFNAPKNVNSSSSSHRDAKNNNSRYDEYDNEYDHGDNNDYDNDEYHDDEDEYYPDDDNRNRNRDDRDNSYDNDQGDYRFEGGHGNDGYKNSNNERNRNKYDNTNRNSNDGNYRRDEGYHNNSNNGNNSNSRDDEEHMPVDSYDRNNNHNNNNNRNNRQYENSNGNNNSNAAPLPNAHAQSKQFSAPGVAAVAEGKMTGSDQQQHSVEAKKLALLDHSSHLQQQGAANSQQQLAHTTQGKGPAAAVSNLPQVALVTGAAADVVSAYLQRARSHVFNYQPVLRATYRELKHYVTAPCQPGVTARCYIERNRSGSKMLAPYYSICADLDGE